MSISIISRHPLMTAMVLFGAFALALELSLVRGALFAAAAVVVALFAIRLMAIRLADIIARIRVSIRWKIAAALALIALPFISVSLINFEAMNYMHAELHAIEDLGVGDPVRVAGAVGELEQTQHGPLFSLAPLVAIFGAICALTLGSAIALSVIGPLRKMKEAMRRMAAGDFGGDVIVPNRDELGELAAHMNSTARDLARLREATVAEERARALRERIAQVTAAQEDERRRISRELHDGLGPSLAALANRMRACEQIVRADPAAAEAELGDMRERIKEHIQEIRELIHGLRPLTVDQLGLVGAARQQLEQFAAETGMSVLLLLSPVALDPLAEVTMFRVLQECLSNVRRHAGSTELEVRLRETDGGVELVVRDDGRGFDSNNGSVHTGAGVGLVGMRERAEAVDGRLSVRSSPGRGCEVTLFVPHARPLEAGMESQRGNHPSPVG